jgi:hypothetical protein
VTIVSLGPRYVSNPFDCWTFWNGRYFLFLSINGKEKKRRRRNKIMVEIRCVWETLQKIYDDKVEKVLSHLYLNCPSSLGNELFFARKQLEN